MFLTDLLQANVVLVYRNSSGSILHWWYRGMDNSFLGIHTGLSVFSYILFDMHEY